MLDYLNKYISIDPQLSDDDRHEILATLEHLIFAYVYPIHKSLRLSSEYKLYQQIKKAQVCLETDNPSLTKMRLSSKLKQGASEQVLEYTQKEKLAPHEADFLRREWLNNYSNLQRAIFIASLIDIDLRKENARRILLLITGFSLGILPQIIRLLGQQ